MGGRQKRVNTEQIGQNMTMNADLGMYENDGLISQKVQKRQAKNQSYYPVPNPNDRSEPLKISEIKKMGYFSDDNEDHTSEQSRVKSRLTRKKLLDVSNEHSLPKNTSKQPAQTNQIFGKPNLQLDFSENLHFKLKLDNSIKNTDKVFKKKMINKARIQIKSKIKKPSENMKYSESENKKDTSAINPLMNNMDESQNTNFFSATQKLTDNSMTNFDSSIKRNFSDLKSPPVNMNDFSAVKLKLEAIQEQNDEIKQSNEFNPNRNDNMRTSMRYRKSLVGQPKEHPTKPEVWIEDMNPYQNKILELDNDELDDSQDMDETMNNFEEIMKKNKKKKNSKRIDFDDFSTDIIKEIHDKQKSKLFTNSEAQTEAKEGPYESKDITTAGKAQNLMSNLFSKDTSCTGNHKSMNEASSIKHKTKQESICEINEWDEDFMSKPKKAMKPNNLLQYLSNDDLSNMSMFCCHSLNLLFYSL